MNEKKFLSYFLKDKNLENNSLVISPTGSGKTHFIFNELIRKGRYLYLCDNENLKTVIEEKERTFSNRKEIEGFDDFSVEVMCYKQFGRKVLYDNSIINQYEAIVCDEIHNLIDYQTFNNDVELSHAIKELFKKYDATKIIYFTATPYYLKVLEENYPALAEILDVIDFSKNKDIRRYINKREAYINHFSQIQFQLDEYKQSFEYANLKCLIFTREIHAMKKLEKMCIDRNLKPICIWSRNNQVIEMNLEQLRVRDYLLKNGSLPEPYNVLIINRALETGVNITDKDMNLAIVNTTNLTQQIQVRGRIRHDIDLLVVRTKEQKLPYIKIDLDEKYLDIELTKNEVEEIVVSLNLKNKKNQYVTVTKFLDILQKHKYKVQTKRKTANYIKSTYYIISEN
ncbi:DEAD/DEAH box helicase family protein [Priestia megaterium]|uniref:DEAD/DEAH box helicase family protein n=1 Tax=Priestia megaterium TaxID=1404 RepID=UPI00077D74B7|nr:DEAD/DEAH box helicase family protein [Priestia megaterium]